MGGTKKEESNLLVWERRSYTVGLGPSINLHPKPPFMSMQGER
jgi:hypothetical protein